MTYQVSVSLNPFRYIELQIRIDLTYISQGLFARLCLTNVFLFKVIWLQYSVISRVFGQSKCPISEFISENLHLSRISQNPYFYFGRTDLKEKQASLTIFVTLCK